MKAALINKAGHRKPSSDAGETALAETRVSFKPRFNWALPIWVGLVGALLAFIVSAVALRTYVASTTLCFSFFTKPVTPTQPQATTNKQAFDAWMKLDSDALRSAVVTSLNLQQRWHLPMADAISRLHQEVWTNIGPHGFVDIDVADNDARLAKAIAGGYLSALTTLAAPANKSAPAAFLVLANPTVHSAPDLMRASVNAVIAFAVGFILVGAVSRRRRGRSTVF